MKHCMVLRVCPKLCRPISCLLEFVFWTHICHVFFWMVLLQSALCTSRVGLSRTNAYDIWTGSNKLRLPGTWSHWHLLGFAPSLLFVFLAMLELWLGGYSVQASERKSSLLSWRETPEPTQLVLAGFPLRREYEHFMSRNIDPNPSIRSLQVVRIERIWGQDMVLEP